MVFKSAKFLQQFRASPVTTFDWTPSEVAGDILNLFRLIVFFNIILFLPKTCLVWISKTGIHTSIRQQMVS